MMRIKEAIHRKKLIQQLNDEDDDLQKISEISEFLNNSLDYCKLLKNSIIL